MTFKVIIVKINKITTVHNFILGMHILFIVSFYRVLSNI